MSNVNTIYYFQIGDADADEAGCFVGMQGNVVCADNEIHKLRAFASRRLADQFFATMNGRYAGVRLRLCTAPVRRGSKCDRSGD